MRPFDMLRACFWLLATVLASQLIVVTLGAFSCFYLFLTHAAEIGACSSFTERTVTIWAEMLATVLALLLASRGEPPNPPPDE